MPIYEYQCSACGHRLEHLQKLSDPDPERCPACGVEGLRRRVSAPAFRLAGNGWYETDFKGDKDRRRNLAERSDDRPASAEAGEKPAATPPAASAEPARPAADAA
jgi:putative FmdB family regulatory protein